jgi:HSP20 family protein
MANEKTHEIQTTDGGAGTDLEQTKAGPVYTPAVDIFESENEITLLADMPGVKPADLTIDLHEGVLTFSGESTSTAGDNEVADFREYNAGRFYRQFSLSDKVDQDKIEARLRDGVLRLVLPKAAATKPKQIKIKTG